MRYLQTLGERDETVWFHLNELVGHVLRERPLDSMRYFEELSRDLRMRKMLLKADPFKEERQLPARLDEAGKLIRFYRKVQCLHEPDDPYTDLTPADRELVENYSLLREAGVGIPKTELYNIYMGIRYLSKRAPVTWLRLWGIVLGTEASYVVVEGQLTEEALKERTEREEARARERERPRRYEREMPETGMDEMDEERELRQSMGSKGRMQKGFVYDFPPVPVAIPKVKESPPYEKPGEGINKTVYYVTNDPKMPWTELPDVLPEHIVCARKIHKLLTGRLESEVVSFPAFPGKEVDLLRAQIARISAGTKVSPLGYYQGSSEEEAVVLDNGELFAEDPDYEPLPIKNLLDENLEFWAHHEKYILRHGTTSPWQADSKGTEYNQSLDGEEEEDVVGSPLEMPPEILRTLSNDVMEEPAPPWTTRQTSGLMEDNSAVMIRSNVWPGAVTVAKGKVFQNFYVGWATKTQFGGYRPPQLPELQEEFPSGSQITEMPDPSVEIEEMRWLALHPPKVPYMEMAPEEEEDEVDLASEEV